jgi:branched-chain amino acid transport system permease protein
MSYLKGFRYILLFFFLMLLPLVTNNYTQYIINLIIVYIVVILGFNIILGFIGQFSFANAAFLGIGAYSSGLLMVHLHLSFWLAMPLAGFITAILGSIIGLPALRLKVYYMAIVTIAFTLLMQYVYLHGGGLTFGVGGFKVPTPEIFGYAVSSDKEKYFVILPLAIIIIFLTNNMLKTKYGRAFCAIRESEQTAQSFGINILYFKVIALLISAFIVGIGGSLFAVVVGYVCPESFGLLELLVQLIIVVVGGLGSITGCIIGPMLLTAIPELLRHFRGFEELLFGLLLILFVILMPSGTYGIIVKYKPIFREKLYREIRKENAR